jgi:hypothetical protein
VQPGVQDPTRFPVSIGRSRTHVCGRRSTSCDASVEHAERMSTPSASARASEHSGRRRQIDRGSMDVVQSTALIGAWFEDPAAARSSPREAVQRRRAVQRVPLLTNRALPQRSSTTSGNASGTVRIPLAPPRPRAPAAGRPGCAMACSILAPRCATSLADGRTFSASGARCKGTVESSALATPAIAAPSMLVTDMHTRCR